MIRYWIGCQQMECPMLHKLIIQTNNGTIDIGGDRDPLMELFNALVNSRKANDKTLIISTPSGYPMMFDPLAITHIAVSPI